VFSVVQQSRGCCLSAKLKTHNQHKQIWHLMYIVFSEVKTHNQHKQIWHLMYIVFSEAFPVAK